MFNIRRLFELVTVSLNVSKKMRDIKLKKKNNKKLGAAASLGCMYLPTYMGNIILDFEQ